jgi:hypothetical protein
MRYPNFASTLKSYGTIADIQERFGFKSRTQTIQYLQGRSLPRAEKILPYPDLLEAARRDVMAQREIELVAA